ncbi:MULTISPECIES: NADH:flavin oxidoreductase [Synergistaceae]|jgi:2,4-dienoyl-CoA reductase-like NADH-dependent reductase (Old Yellow Enzyme family)|uniref:oxidoreductase n=1 Tax=Synergistaceae TaxID=649777 RepID=UPI003ADC81D6|nr:NADH:flavin oxidoreductase [Synergistaceae bacterium DZ-S4]
MIFEPIELKGSLLKNRVISAPLASSSSMDDGSPSERSLEIYRRFASSGAALFVVEHHAVTVSGRTRPAQFLADSDVTAKKHSAVSAILKGGNALCLAQINHAGAKIADRGVFDMEGYRPLSPSGIPVGDQWEKSGRKPETMTRGEIRRTVEDFVNSAVRMVRIGGYDGIQIHASHGYLIGQFLSPLTNRRDDEYGGTDRKRARLLYEITDAVRQSLNDAPLSVRLGAADFLPGDKPVGLSLDETVPVARELVNLGVDMIGISGNLCGYGIDRNDSAYFAPYAQRIKTSVGSSALVECTGGIRDVFTAEKILRDGVCDLVGVGRQMLRDPGFLAGWKESC